MTTKVLHPVVDLLKVSGQPKRVENFVWVYLAQISDDRSIENSTEFPERRCEELLSAWPHVLDHLREVVSHSWIPESDLSWLNGDDRQAFWSQQYVARAIQEMRQRAVAHTLARLAQQQLSKGPIRLENQVTQPDLSRETAPFSGESIPHHLVGAGRSIALVDYWSSCKSGDVKGMRDAVQEMERNWSQQLRIDRTYAWLDGSDGEGRRHRFWEGLLARFEVPPGQRSVPQSHGQLLNAIDELDQHPDAITLFNQRARKEFQQQQRRARNASKKQCNFELETATLAKLKALARKHDISQTAVIDLLIREESERPFHIPEKLRRNRALLGPA